MKFNKIFVLLLLLCGLFVSCDAFDEDDENSSGGGEATSYDMQIFDLVNAHRKKIGLSALKYDDDIFNQCYIHSKNMATGKTAFGHDGFSDRVKNLTPCYGAAENVAFNYSTNPEDVVNMWLTSSGHRANIESTQATHSAVSAVKNSNGTWYYTQIFIKR
ncbi:MAG: CAP domain-containing protein [Treponema sp.]|nr:CAP domain-containing protein [Treponema sp.]